jgi:DNA-binding HxlR family transcriptional regulator
MVTNVKQDVANQDCPITATLSLIGGRWKTLILYQLTTQTRRFGEICVRIPSISRKVLTEQLRELERDGLIVRKQFNETPPRVEYSLSEMGKALSPVFDEMAVWGLKNILRKDS